MEQPTLLDVDPFARHSADFYATPAYQTLALLKRLPDLRQMCILEPCVGDGAIVRELSSPHVVMNDIIVRDEQFPPDFLLDATNRDSWLAFRRFDRIELVITNPPFEPAFDIVRHAVEFAERGVAMLLRLSWLEPTEERGPWLAEHPPEGVIVLPRYDYRGNGKTDSVTSAWVIWSKAQPLLQASKFDFVTKAERDALMVAA